MQRTAEAQLAIQLQTVIRTHMRRYQITPTNLAAQMGLTEWAINGMLDQHTWDLSLCLRVIEALNISVTVQEANAD